MDTTKTNPSIPLLYVHKPHVKISNKGIESYNLSSENVEVLIKKFETLRQNQNENPKIKQYLKKFHIILPFESCRVSLFQVLSSRAELKGHFSSIVYLLSIFEQFIELLHQFSEMARESQLKRVSFLNIEKKIEEIDLTHEKFKILATDIVEHIKNGTTPNDEDGIVHLKEIKCKNKIRKNLLLGLGTTSTVFGIAAISIGIVLAPFTGGITLLSTIAGVSTIVAGATTTTLGTAVAIIGNKYFNQKEIDIKRSIEALEMLASQVEVLAISISKNDTIKNQLENDFDHLVQNELEFLNLFCGICFDIVKEPVIIPLPNDENRGQYEIYCRDCITQWHNESLPAQPTLPKSRLPFSTTQFLEPDFRTKGDVIRFNNLINDMKLKLSSIITSTTNND